MQCKLSVWNWKKICGVEKEESTCQKEELYTLFIFMYIIHCTLYIVHCTLYIVHCTLYIVHCTLYIVHCTLYILHCTLYIVHCILYINTYKHVSIYLSVVFTVPAVEYLDKPPYLTGITWKLFPSCPGTRRYSSFIWPAICSWSQTWTRIRAPNHRKEEV